MCTSNSEQLPCPMIAGLSGHTHQPRCILLLLSLVKVLINVVSGAMGKTLSFEESGEAVYAAMVKVNY